jgi:hypothetical protein
MFGKKRGDEEEGTIVGGISLVIQDAGDDVLIRAKCRKSEIKYLMQIIIDRLKAYEEEPARPARPRLRGRGH